MQDVIFAGGRGMPSRRSAEVEFTVDNSDRLIPLEFSEVSIARRLDRSGTSEYRINGARCRLIDIVELISDTGLGKEMHSFVSQGAVEEIVHSKPQQRRLIVEEAAGLSKHRKRRRRGQLKLERTQDNLDRLLDIEREARTRLRPLKRQAEAAEHHRRLEHQSLELEAQLVADQLLDLRSELGLLTNNSAGAVAERDRFEKELSAAVAARRQAEEELTERGSERELLTRAYFGAQAAADGAALHGDRCQQLGSALERKITVAIEAEAAESARQAQLRLRMERTDAMAPVVGAQRLLDQVTVSGSSAELVEMLLADAWRVEGLEQLPESFAGIAITAEGSAYIGIEKGRRHFGLEQKQLDSELELTLEKLADRSSGLQAIREVGREVIAAATHAAEVLERCRARLEREFESSRDDSAETTAKLRQLAAEENALQAKLREANETLTQSEVKTAQCRDREAEVASQLTAVGEKLGSELEPAQSLADDQCLELEQKIGRLARRREQLGPVNPLAKDEYEEALAHVAELESQRCDLESALKELKQLIGEIDQEIEERFDKTMNAASKNFEQVVEQLFPGGRGRIRLVKPQELRLVIGDGEEPEDDAKLAAESVEEGSSKYDGWGVEVEVNPAGKTMKRLSLLSGGEKSLVALAFLFAVFLARPCPFYILDEVEAALDEINIDRFLGLLKSFSARAQFIVITHQRRTLDAADAVYGVSMAADGVSKVVSRKLKPAVADQAAQVENKARAA